MDSVSEPTPADRRLLPALPRRGDEVGPYSILAELGHGGMAAIYVARRGDAEGFGRLFAVKLLLPHLATDSVFVDMFLDECRIASHIHHAHVVQVFDVGMFGELPYMVMEYLQGQSLARLLRRAWFVPEPSMTRGVFFQILAAVARGLHAAHEAKDQQGAPLEVVHRDVSPDNVHVDYTGHVRVVDFGIAAARGRITRTRTGEVKGKLAYLSPEQLSGAATHRGADLWALGVIAYESLSRTRLFRRDNDPETMFNVLNLRVPPLRDAVPDVPEDVARCIEACVQRDAHRRPASALEVAKVFAAAAERSGEHRPETLAAVMEATFAPDRAVEEERVAAAIRDRAEPLRSTMTEEPPVLPDVDTVARARTLTSSRVRWGLLGLGAAALILGAGLGVWGWAPDGEPTPDDSSVSTRVVDPPLEPPPGEAPADDAPAEPPRADEADPAEPPPTTVELTVAGGVASVLVDGVADPRRPLRVRLGDDGTRRLVLLDAAGRAHTRTVTIRDDGSTLRLARRPRRRARRSRSSAGSSGPLPSPYP